MKVIMTNTTKAITSILIILMLVVGCANNGRLHLPAMDGDLEKIRSEINNGMDVDSSDSAGRTALMYAVFSNRIEVMEYLIGHGANVDTMDDVGSTALIYAAGIGHMDALKLLLKNNAATEIKNNKKQTALDVAMELNREEIIKQLLKHYDQPID
jgi:ankyrin repeat protein